MNVQQRISKLYFERDIDGMSELEVDLISKKMTQYKEFSTFLENAQYGELNHEELDTPLWDTYKKMTEEYHQLVANISLCSYYKGMIYVQQF